MGYETGLLRFREAYFPRIWGGNKLHEVYGISVASDRPVGEAWLVADHAQHESVVAQGPREGATLRQLLEENAEAILGTHARLTSHGRFPLLLKLLDAAEHLSVQVHPDDEAAERLGEPDVGKTEMWHVIDADPGSELICGLPAGMNRDALRQAVEDGSIEERMVRFHAPPGTSVFVAAGTVHAIGAGILLAEIQQNSDITYRLHDWGRVDETGAPRELHVDRALEVTHFDAPHAGPNTPLSYRTEGARIEVLAACRYFAAERVLVDKMLQRSTHGRSFHLLLAAQRSIAVQAGEDEVRLRPGEAVLVPAAAGTYSVPGPTEFLTYYVPDLAVDVAAPLLAAEQPEAAIVRLGGAPAHSDLRTHLA